MSVKPVMKNALVCLLALLLMVRPSMPAFAAQPGVGDASSTGRSLGVKMAQSRGPQQKFRSAEQVVGWINDYRKAPEPLRVPHAIRALSRFGAFEDIDQAGLYAGFLAGVLGDNQLKVRALITDLFPMNPKSQAIIIMGIAYSGLPEWRSLLREFAERMPQRTVLIDKFMFGSYKTLQDAPLDQSPDVVDALWGYYIATGYLAPVERLLEALRWTSATDNSDHFTLAHMSMWTLAANAERDRPLLRFYRAQLRHAPKALAEPLKKVIYAAERFETARLKKIVIATIATQKRHKP
ncbi:MAG: hypothetical protein L3J67_11840, partial [Hyphomicrobiaceae bacterium]|nr:hypothetical protein [Hyphomicrobiaceae bacterium]